MMRACQFLIMLLVYPLLHPAAAQTAADRLEALQQSFREFKYEEAVLQADSALAKPQDFSRDQLVQLDEIKAASLYSLNQIPEAFSCYVEILKMSPDHSLDPVRTSPKLVSFFEEIKARFQKMPGAATMEPPPTKIDTVKIILSTESFYRRVLPPSFILPGAGHWLAGNKKKAVPLAIVSAATLIWAVDATLDCREKEKIYLGATEPEDIESRYSAYNTAYKTRNLLWGAYALVWGYAQADLLFRQRPEPAVRLTLLPAFSPSESSWVICSLHF
jgi:hypothetical protein